MDRNRLAKLNYQIQRRKLQLESILQDEVWLSYELEKNEERRKTAAEQQQTVG